MLAFGINAVLKIVLSGASATPPHSFNGVDGFDVESGPTTIQLFSNPVLTNEGKTFLGQIQKKTSRKGKAPFSFFGPAVAQGDEITATATSADGTSEFSDPVSVVPASWGGVTNIRRARPGRLANLFRAAIGR